MNPLKLFLCKFFYKSETDKGNYDNDQIYLTREFLIDLINEFQNKSGIHLISKYYQDDDFDKIFREIDELKSGALSAKTQEDRFQILQKIEEVCKRTYYLTLSKSICRQQDCFRMNFRNELD